MTVSKGLIIAAVVIFILAAVSAAGAVAWPWELLIAVGLACSAGSRVS